MSLNVLNEYILNIFVTYFTVRRLGERGINLNEIRKGSCFVMMNIITLFTK